MPVFRYKCECGLSHDQFLRADKDSVILKCERCRRDVSAHQVRDNLVKFAENNEVVGVLRHEAD